MLARFGFLAARVSSKRLIGVVRGHAIIDSGSVSTNFTISIRASMNSSSVSFDSVSVGSIIRASGTINGKYIVGG